MCKMGWWYILVQKRNVMTNKGAPIKHYTVKKQCRNNDRYTTILSNPAILIQMSKDCFSDNAKKLL